jgi:hypothetical protein
MIGSSRTASRLAPSKFRPGPLAARQVRLGNRGNRKVMQQRVFARKGRT